MSHNYYKIISINSSCLKCLSESSPAELTSPYADISCITFDSTLNESLETMHLVEVCKQKGYTKKFFSDLVKATSTSSFRGYTTAVIEFNIASPKMSKAYISTLYKNGFVFNGETYLRYKRSASSAREGKCLFIANSLFNEMYDWSCCGLTPNFNDASSLTAWEAYISLTLSGIESTLSLPRNSILLIPDGKSIFKNRVMNVKNERKEIIVEEEEIDIENSIWDGEALLDDSVFMNLPGYEKQSMLLLRNRFFKTCAFRTNLHKWFDDNGIKTIRQLNGFTLNTEKRPSQCVKDILLVITPSSLKYLKFALGENETPPSNIQIGLEKWLYETSKNSHTLTFGIVKSDHPTKHVNGTMVQTNYQLLSTLGLNRDETERLLSSTMEYIKNINNNPSYFLHYLNLSQPLITTSEYDDYNFNSTKEKWFELFDSDINLENYQYEVINKLIPYSKQFAKTSIYQAFLKNQLDSFKRKVRHGNILVDGTYATLFGNCIEFLYATIHKDFLEVNGEIKSNELCYANGTRINTLRNNEVYTTFFDADTDICGARSPHVTMGNLFHGKNTYNEFINTYFPISSSIICINSINHNIMHRLNGADFDSDAMLITNNQIIANAVKRQYEHFLVPVNSVSTINSKKKKTTTYPIHLLQAKVDTAIFNNYIGKIINLSLLFNSLLWDRFHNTSAEFQWDEASAFYEDLCKLAILSNIEIDKAKRTYVGSVRQEFKHLEMYGEIFRTAQKSTSKRYICDYPAFYSFLTCKKLSPKKDSDSTETKYGKHLKNLEKTNEKVEWDCTMHYIHRCIKELRLTHPDAKNPIKLHNLVAYNNKEINFAGSNDSRNKEAIIKLAQECQNTLNRLHSYNTPAALYVPSSTLLLQKREILQNTFSLISKKIRNKHIIHLVLNDIDQGNTRGFNALLFASLVLSTNGLFREMLIFDPVPLLHPCDSASSNGIKIYNQYFQLK